MKNYLKFKQVKNQNFYTATTSTGAEILKSYNTIVGYIVANHYVYRVRYSTTTGKQITRYINENLETALVNYVTAEKLHDIIKASENMDLNCDYNGAWAF